MNELLAAALVACIELGLIFRTVPADGKFYPLDVEGKTIHNGAGRIRLFFDGEGGQAWNHITSESRLFWANTNQIHTPIEQAERRQRADAERERAERELAGARQKAKEISLKILSVAQPPKDNVYLMKKCVLPTDRLLEIPLETLVKLIGYHPKAKGKSFTGMQILIAPVSNRQGVTTIEMIDETGLKAGLSNGQKKGCCWTTGKLPAGDGTGLTVGIGEGVVTMLTYYMSSGHIGIASLSCGNMKEVALLLRGIYPKATIIIVSDIGNGEQSAVEAARSVNALIVKPTVPTGSTGTDINDVYTELGPDEAKRQIEMAAPVDPIKVPVSDTEVTTEILTGQDDDHQLTAAVDRLALLPPLQYDKVRKDEAKALGVRPSTLDASIKVARKGNGSDDSPFVEVEPWPKPIDGAVLLSAITSTIRRFIICERETANAAALWIMMCWFIEVILIAPLAVITAPEKRCGKSLLLGLIGNLVPKPLMSSNISPSALYRSIELWQPTLLIDEADACLKDNEELRGLINCGHTRDGAYTLRCVGDDHTPKRFNVWGAKAISGIGHVADTLMDRSIVLELRRKLPHESVDRIRHADPNLFSDLRSMLARFADDNSEPVRLARPELPFSLNDRAQDNWEPLLAIATVAGGDWLNFATAAALKLSGGESPSMGVGAELLADIKEIFDHKKIDHIFTAELIHALISDDEKRWASYNRGYEITPRQVAAKLKEYGVHSKTVRIGTATSKGYDRGQLTEAFARYIPLPISNDTIQLLPIENVTTSQIPEQADQFVTNNPSRYPSVTDRTTCSSPPIGTCDVNMDKSPILVNEIIDLTGIDFDVIS